MDIKCCCWCNAHAWISPCEKRPNRNIRTAALQAVVYLHPRGPARHRRAESEGIVFDSPRVFLTGRFSAARKVLSSTSVCVEFAHRGLNASHAPRHDVPDRKCYSSCCPPMRRDESDGMSRKRAPAGISRNLSMYVYACRVFSPLSRTSSGLSSCNTKIFLSRIEGVSLACESVV
jgi:hypothetical protein